MVGLGGGRTRPEDGIDHAVGVTRLAPVGSAVMQDDLLAMVHANASDAAERAAAAIRAAYSIGPVRPPAQKPVIRRVSPAV